jgi:hypothetical protein
MIILLGVIKIQCAQVMEVAGELKSALGDQIARQ